MLPRKEHHKGLSFHRFNPTYIYLHYVLDLWFEKRVKARSKGKAHLFRYADDFLVDFQYKEEGERFEENLKEHIEGFCLQIAPAKTQRVEFGPFAVQNAKRRGQKAPTFTFLGFTHYCGKTRHCYFKVKRYTSRKKLWTKLREYDEWLRKARRVTRTGELMRRA